MRSERLEKLYRRVDRCKLCKAAGNKLHHIHGFGAGRPRWMLVLVNPTYRNLSSSTEYRGPRFPFIGVRQFWRVLADGGLIDKNTASDLPLRSAWTARHTKQLQQELIRNDLFLTNLVKCCYQHSEYPKSRVLENQLPFLAEEIRIVKPKKIVAFGGLVYKVLTARSIKLSEYWTSAHSGGEVERISGLSVDVLPCYFPIGRGKPHMAAKVLRRLSQ